MPIISGFVVPKMNPTSHVGNIRLLRPVVVTVEHQEDSQAENNESKDKEEPEEILHIVSEVPETQTCYPLVGIVYNPMLLPFLSGSTVFLTNENSLQNCSLNHSPIGCPLMASASLDLSFGSFTTWKPALSVVNFRL